VTEHDLELLLGVDGAVDQEGETTSYRQGGGDRYLQELLLRLTLSSGSDERRAGRRKADETII